MGHTGMVASCQGSLSAYCYESEESNIVYLGEPIITTRRSYFLRNGIRMKPAAIDELGIINDAKVTLMSIPGGRFTDNHPSTDRFN